MIEDNSYKIALFLALSLHILLGFFLSYQHYNKQPVLVAARQNDPGRMNAIDAKIEPIKAVGIDQADLLKTMNALKAEKLAKQQQEEHRQRQLDQQVALAKKQRMEEQQRLVKIKEEALKLEVAHKKAMEEEKKRLVELKKKQEEIQKQQAMEEQKLVEMKKKSQIAKQKQDLEQKKRAAQLAAAEAERQAQMAGEIDKYKALILGAISQQWILPENANRSLSSEFKIHLAPNGAVLNITLTRSSGDSILDRSAQDAISKASPLPVPQEARVFDLFREITLTVRPQNARG